MHHNKTCFYGHAVRYFTGEYPDPSEHLNQVDRILEFADIMGLQPQVAAYLYNAHRRPNDPVRTREDAAKLLRKLATLLEQRR